MNLKVALHDRRLTGTERHLTRIRPRASRGKIPGGLVPVINPRLLVTPQHTGDRLGYLVRCRSRMAEQPREHLTHLGHRDRGCFPPQPVVVPGTRTTAPRATVSYDDASRPSSAPHSDRAPPRRCRPQTLPRSDAVGVARGRPPLGGSRGRHWSGRSRFATRPPDGSRPTALPVRFYRLASPGLAPSWHRPAAGPSHPSGPQSASTVTPVASTPRHRLFGTALRACDRARHGDAEGVVARGRAPLCYRGRPRHN